MTSRALAQAQIPRYETREEKARRLIDTECVDALCDFGAIASAVVTGDHGTYNTIIFADGTFACECKWGEYNNRTRDRCSHALAVALVVEET